MSIYLYDDCTVMPFMPLLSDGTYNIESRPVFDAEFDYVDRILQYSVCNMMCSMTSGARIFLSISDDDEMHEILALLTYSCRSTMNYISYIFLVNRFEQSCVQRFKKSFLLADSNLVYSERICVAFSM